VHDLFEQRSVATSVSSLLIDLVVVRCSKRVESLAGCDLKEGRNSEGAAGVSSCSACVDSLDLMKHIVCRLLKLNLKLKRVKISI